MKLKSNENQLNEVDIMVNKMLNNPYNFDYFKALEANPNRLISSNFNDFLNQAELLINNLLISMSSLSKSEIKDNEKIKAHASILRLSVGQIILNLCFSIESATNLFSSLSHPLTKYDFSKYYEDLGIDKKLGKIVFGKMDTDCIPMYKVAMLFGTYFNSLKNCKHYGDFQFEVKSQSSLPVFNKKNLNILQNSNEIIISKKGCKTQYNNLSTKYCLDFIERMFHLRNSIVHSSPQNSFNALKYINSLAEGKTRSFDNNLKVFIPLVISQDLSTLLFERMSANDLFNCSKVILNNLVYHLENTKFILKFFSGVHPYFYNGIKYIQTDSSKFIYQYEKKSLNNPKLPKLDDYCKQIIEKEFEIVLSDDKAKWPDVSFLEYKSH